MEKIINLTNEQIRLYENLSGAKIDMNIDHPAGKEGWYFIIDKNNNKRWRRAQDLLNYIKSKTIKEINNNLNNLTNNFKSKTFIFDTKEPVLIKSVCLTKTQIEKVKKMLSFLSLASAMSSGN